VLPARIPPVGVWSIVMAAATIVASIATRRRLDSSPRVQRVTTATVTTSAGFGLILLVALVAEALS